MRIIVTYSHIMIIYDIYDIDCVFHDINSHIQFEYLLQFNWNPICETLEKQAKSTT